MIQVRRRRFLITAGAVLAAPRTAFAQQASKVWRIGFVGTAFASGYVRELDWVREGLRKFGYVEGKNVVIEYRWAEGSNERLQSMAAELVSLKVDLLLAHSNTGAAAAKLATSTIPIVMADGADPVLTGLVTDLARPGGNLTGSSSFVPEEIAKRLQLLKEVVPRIARVAFLFTRLNPAIIAVTSKSIAAAAAAVKVELHEFVVREAADLPGAFNAMSKARIDGIVVSNEPLLNSHAGTVASLAAVKGLPAVGYASFADAGGLLAYGANRAALYGRVGYFVDRIFKGAKPGDIPFERAAKFDTVINLKTAKALGITIPPTVLLRADRVIE